MPLDIAIWQKPDVLWRTADKESAEGCYGEEGEGPDYQPGLTPAEVQDNEGYQGDENHSANIIPYRRDSYGSPTLADKPLGDNSGCDQLWTHSHSRHPCRYAEEEVELPETVHT